MSQLIWLHEDCLRATHRLFTQAASADAARPVFIWDDVYMSAMHYGLKRRVFIYESLCELQLDIYVGDTIDTLKVLQSQLGVDEIITGKTPNPALKAVMQNLRASAKLSAIADAPFVQMDSPPDLRRFFKYWNKAKKNAFLYDGRP
ncbi:hypothetical protein N9Y14_01565 [Alphaproteobacteria bacterium]|nr:hypothetical protein [Alphaproteobacteria bacterium]MDA8624688.1 hypothetical protein [Alphaproteobacteria bacterium]MDA8642823.1 hypothetical protein [Alphaproteobacteria bacterium]MDA8666181.1 hypothetical protein [Alphaproteobacteria bacterium]MDB2381383.1 hypothetical protein [Alphaproteobacteria bacterium]